MSTKNDIINRAYQEIRISGLTVNPSPADDALALNRLESMMAEYFSGMNMDLGYNFESTPNINSQTNLPLAHEYMAAANLAIRLVPAFNKQVPQVLYNLASGAFSSSLAIVKSEQIRQVQPPRTMPRGSGNTFRRIYGNRYQHPEPLPPVSAANNQIFVGETYDYEESFAAWLGANTIASFTIASDNRLIIDSSTNNDPVINYTITASTDTASGVWQYVKITVTDSAGRVQIRLINFEVVKPPEVP